MSLIANKAIDFGNADIYDARPNGFDVYSWSPAPPGVKGPLTQVHLHMPITGLGLVVTRFKSTDTIDRLIAALQEHRKYVWGDP